MTFIEIKEQHSTDKFKLDNMGTIVILIKSFYKISF